ncbi:MAG: HEAT repeat domain-containing protein [Planctomycetes bacterium]|nr:HEAT repeat domain-containing protein [Planctomycetota bacterium]
MTFAQLESLWQKLLAEKTYKYRNHYLNQIWKGSFPDLVQLFLQSRICISPDIDPADSSSRSIFFAREWKRGRLTDVVRYNVVKRGRSYVNSSIALFEWIDIGRIPGEKYFVQARALASVKTGAICGGTWQEIWSLQEPAFIPAVAARIPRLQSFPGYGRIIECIWSPRDARLAAFLADLGHRTEKRRLAALQEIGFLKWEPNSIPSVATRIARDGMRAFMDGLTESERSTNRGARASAVDVLQRIAVQCPELTPAFAKLLQTSNPVTRIGAVRGLLAVARGNESSIPLLIGLLDDPNPEICREMLAGISGIFHYGESNWPAAGSNDRGRAKRQSELVLHVGTAILQFLKANPPADLDISGKLALFRIQSWSPALQKRVRTLLGNLQTILWPALAQDRGNSENRLQ